MFGEIVSQEPSMTDAWDKYASVLARLGRNDEAILAFQESDHDGGRTTTRQLFLISLVS